MIKNIKNKALNKLVNSGDRSLLASEQIRKIEKILISLNAANTLEDINLPGFKLHKLKGELKEYYAITVTGNYRIIFKFEDGNVYDVDYTDYH